MDQGILQPYSIQAPQIRSAEVYLKATFLLIVSQECNAILQYPPLIQYPALGSLLFAKGGIYYILEKTNAMQYCNMGS